MLLLNSMEKILFQEEDNTFQDIWRSIIYLSTGILLLDSPGKPLQPLNYGSQLLLPNIGTTYIQKTVDRPGG